MREYMITGKDGMQTPIGELKDNHLRKLAYKSRNNLSKSIYFLFHVLGEYKKRGIEHPKLLAEGKAEAVIMSSFVRAWSLYHGKDLRKVEKEKREEE